MRITIATAGTRGDIQPYIALGRGLQRVGHAVRLATNSLFQDFVTSWGLEFVPLEYVDYNDREPAILNANKRDLGRANYHLFKALEKLSWQHLNPIEFFPDFVLIVRFYSYRLLAPEDSFLPDLYQACQGADAIIFAPHLLQSLDIAEKLGVPCYAACAQPLTQTRAFPHLYMPIGLRLGNIYLGLHVGGIYNWLTYLAFDQFLWRSIRQPVNQWRQETLGLSPIPSGLSPLVRMPNCKIPFLYSYSPSFLPKPPDWAEWLHVTGYWFLDIKTISGGTCTRN